MAARLTAYLVVGIVVTTVIAGLIVGAQRDDADGPVDLIVHNATVYTANSRGATAEAVAIRGNQILSVGSNREIARFQRPQTVMIDARGASVLPGFNDAGLNLIEGGLALRAVNLAGARTSDELVERVAAWGARNRAAEWIVGRGWPAGIFDSAAPSRQALDGAVRDRPVVLFAADNASAWVNSEALRRAGITRKSKDPEHGAILRDRKGDPAGLLKGSAVELVAKLVPAPSRDERLDAIREAVEEANALGITSVQSTESSPDNLELYDVARRAGELSLRVYSAVRLDRPLTDADVPSLKKTREKYPDDPLFKAGAVVIPLDGDVFARTAAMLEPYEDDPDTSVSAFSPDDLNRTARLADAAGWQIVTQAAGDRAVRTALTAFAHAARSNQVPAHGRRHRIDRLALVDAADLPRFAPLGIVASMQPVRSMPSGERLERLARNLGEERASRTFAFNTMADATRLVFGSGWPANQLDPLAGLHVAVNQATPEGTPEGGWHPAERLDLKAAINAYTATSAWASFDEQRKGSLSPGMLADLVILDRDIFDAPPSTLASAAVAVTIFDGKVVYSRVPRAETAPAPSLQH